MHGNELPAERMMIGGEWVDAADGAVAATYDPSTGLPIANFARGKQADVDAAVVAARRALEGEWHSYSGEMRSKLLWRIADLIERDLDDLAVLETRNNGMPLQDAKNSVASIVVEQFRYNAGWCTRLFGRTLDLSTPDRELVSSAFKEPIGVVGLIVPWNNPLVMAAMKLAPALAAGCTCVLKPAEETPLTTLWLGRILSEAGLPAGVVNIVTGYGHEAGAAIAAHPGIDKVAFTGSTGIGRRIVEAAAGNLKRVTLELGGKSPMIVCHDANINRVVPGAARAIFRNAGQICHAGTRLIAARSVYNEVVEGIEKLARQIRVGNGFQTDVEMGPLISRKQQERVQGIIQRSVGAGAEILQGAAPDGPGFFVPPTIIGGAKPDMEAVRQEIFGPVLVAMPFDEIDEAVTYANDTEYGLAASIWTGSVSMASRLSRRIKAGQIGINAHTVSHPHMPFGGYKSSGWGRENGPDGIENYLQTKTVFNAI